MILLASLLGFALAAGTTLPSAPPVSPGRAAPLPNDLIAAAIDRRTQGDPHTAAFFYESWLGRKGGTARTRAAVQLALGLSYLDLDAPNLASAMFSKVRASGTPVSPWGAWYEALADHRRGRHAVAARECSAYRKSWPEGPHADECLVLMGDAWVAAGERGPAIAAYKGYLDKFPDSPREETMRLGMALAMTNGDPRAGIPMLQSLVVEHAYHSTGDTAQARLDVLAAQGFSTKLPDAVEWRSKRAAERKRCGYDKEAWTLFSELSEEARENPSLGAWIDAQENNFAWSTKQYDTLAADFAKSYAERPSSDLLQKQYKALTRGGQWREAVDLAIRNPSLKPRVELARAELIAGRYTEARDAWTALGKTGGALGREARWLAAYSAFRATDYPDALVRLDAVITGGGSEADSALYYKARTLDALGRKDEADTLRGRIAAEDPNSWYGVLVRGMDAGEADPWTARAGRWHAPEVPHLPALARVGTGGAPLASPAPVHAFTPTVDWSLLAWGHPAVPRTMGAEAAAVPFSAVPFSAVPFAAVAVPYETRPDSYRPSFLFNPAEGDRLLTKLGDEQAVTFPDLAAAADLARVGVYQHAAPIVGRMYDQLELAPIAGVDLDVGEWRQVFMFARDDHHTARFCWGATKLASNADQRLSAARCAFPSAQADALFRHGQRYDVDPFLALGLMRQESVYRQWALSPVGAMGLMQVMPRTGARVAALMGDPHYSPEQLEDPSTNVRYGTWYLSRLLDRFGGAFPLAVASYNGGPHNVSSWLRPWGDSIRIDDYVEQIPYTETRDYVKKVTGYYATYVALYGPDGAHVRVAPTVTADDPSVIDF